jgi:hypothetical protein
MDTEGGNGYHHTRVEGISMAFISLQFPRNQSTSRELLLPILMSLAFDPTASDGIAIKVSITIPVAVLEQLQERVPQPGVHANALSRVITADSVACEALLKECFVVCAATVQVAGGGHARRVDPTLTPGVVPCAERVTSTV